MLPYYGADTNFSLEGKVAVITGSTAGIGYATAQFFAAKGAFVVINGRNPQADKIAKEIGENVIGVSGDITDKDCQQKLLDAALAKFGKVDILINCAGVGLLDNAESLSEELWDATMNINLKAAFLTSQLFGRYFIENKIPGSIVNVASQAGVIALDRHVAYCASKAAMISMTQVMAKEWGKYGIRVNAVSPTVVLTELGHRAWDGPVGDAFKAQMPSQRFAEPDEVAGVIAFLCSNTAGIITGHNLLIDGGYTIQ